MMPTTAYAPLLLLSGWPSSGPSSATIEPNPAETVWLLGIGGAVTSPIVGEGFQLTLWTQLLNAGVLVPYLAGATLDASVWPGAGEGILFTPTVAWTNPADPTQGLTLVVSSTQSASVGPGRYRLQVGVTAMGVRSLAYDGELQVSDTPGSVPAPLTWCSAADMLLYSDVIGNLRARRDVEDATGFLLQRGQATSKLARMIVKRLDYHSMMVFTRQNTLDPILQTFDVPTPFAAIPSKTDVTTTLATPGGIVLEEQLREIAARMAIALVLRRQATSNVAYRQEAEAQEAMADDLFAKYQAQIVTASPIGGNTNFLVDQNVIILPTGTAP